MERPSRRRRCRRTQRRRCRACPIRSENPKACKAPGKNNRDYHLVLLVCNNCPNSITIDFVVQTLKLNNGVTLMALCGTTLPRSVELTIASKQCAEVDLGWFKSSRGNPSTIMGYDAAGNLLFSADAPPTHEQCKCGTQSPEAASAQEAPAATEQAPAVEPAADKVEAPAAEVKETPAAEAPASDVTEETN
ncbi:MAG: hypothetical protein GX595_09490 [Lentisphaerae bacterium]|uniref:hypothetical protein n=1 Tax=Propioniciclava sp. MC1683 TaxID=2760309 RepID=UPI0015FFDFDF|nr:hypothetical protein [Propioniciclava sp. MC1683]MBB1500038.1 hypothetical protein [Propioniciclava sp. MC1683]NLF17478.1 hypothetical protein [Lentisphaerota bacterium]